LDTPQGIHRGGDGANKAAEATWAKAMRKMLRSAGFAIWFFRWICHMVFPMDLSIDFLFWLIARNFPWFSMDFPQFFHGFLGWSP